VIDLKYSLVIEATDDPTFFGFYSPDLEGFTGIGHSIEDCLYQAKWGMEEHVELLKQQFRRFGNCQKPARPPSMLFFP
jgi:predicted RNase H-like HicB family nuclease